MKHGSMGRYVYDEPIYIYYTLVQESFLVNSGVSTPSENKYYTCLSTIFREYPKPHLIVAIFALVT